VENNNKPKVPSPKEKCLAFVAGLALNLSEAEATYLAFEIAGFTGIEVGNAVDEATREIKETATALKREVGIAESRAQSWQARCVLAQEALNAMAGVVAEHMDLDDVYSDHVIKEHIQNFAPEDFFTRTDLQEWAEANDFVKASETMRPF
jgi:hypothetical protein